MNRIVHIAYNAILVDVGAVQFIRIYAKFHEDILTNKKVLTSVCMAVITYSSPISAVRQMSGFLGKKKIFRTIS